MADTRQLVQDREPGAPQILQVAPFEQWTYDDVLKAVNDTLPEDYDKRYGYCEQNDHFQRGANWVGPGDAASNEKIEKQFAPEDAIGEVLSNIENAFSEPQIGGVGDDPDLIQEAVDYLSDWWDQRKMQELIQECQRRMGWAGWSTLRLWIPSRFLLDGEDGVELMSAEDIPQALSMIHVMAPTPKAAAVIVHSDTQDRIAVFLSKEVVFEDGERSTYDRAELIYLDPDRERDEDADTIIRVVYANEERPGMRAAFRLGGKLLLSEMRRRPVITEPVMRTQNQLNLLTTLLTRMAETAAFRERYISNAKPQGIRYPYNDGDSLPNGAFIERDDEGRQWVVVPQTRTLGANTTTELVGLPTMDKVGDMNGNLTPTVTIVDPGDPLPYMAAAEGVRKRILRMCGQGHLSGESQAEASGIAYEQARSVFEKDLKARKVALEGMLREILTSALRLAERMVGEEGRYTDNMRLTVDQHVYAGPRSPDLARLDLEAIEAGVLSDETVMSRFGVEDTVAELARIQRSPAYLMRLLEGVSLVANFFEPDGMSKMLEGMGVPNNVTRHLKAREIEEVNNDQSGEAPQVVEE